MLKLVHRFSLYALTIRYLRAGQLFWRVWYRLVWWPTKRQLKQHQTPQLAEIKYWIAPIIKQQSFYVKRTTFEFLNRRVEFDNQIDWEYSGHGRLWSYNLHYFDFLNASAGVSSEARTLSDDLGSKLIKDWIDRNNLTEGTGWEPYPTSQRIVNWIKWSLDGRPLCPLAIDSLFRQARWLSHRIEYHILANHLFANVKAMCFAGTYFEGPEPSMWLGKALAILDNELDEQFLTDGGHFERSPMYHDIVLEDVLDLVNVLSNQSRSDAYHIRAKLMEVVRRMLFWSQTMRHPDGKIAFFNDSAFGIAASVVSLAAYADRLMIGEQNGVLKSGGSDAQSILISLKNTGFEVLHCRDSFAIFNVGAIGPDYQPGHAHADSLSFEYSWRSERIFVNSGTSTYNPGELRLMQRSTCLHNTVEIDSHNSSNVWGGFRVANRARTKVLDREQGGSNISVTAIHDGYARLFKKTLHIRKITMGAATLQIEDKISGPWSSAVARYYLHPSIVLLNSSTFSCDSGQVFKLEVSGGRVNILEAKWYPEFGTEVETKCIEFVFSPNHDGPYVFRVSGKY